MVRSKPKLPRWEDPPVIKFQRDGSKTKSFIDREVEAMKQNPGRWMKVREAASGGAYRTYSTRGCETKTRSLGEGKYDIWARWPEAQDGVA